MKQILLLALTTLFACQSATENSDTAETPTSQETEQATEQQPLYTYDVEERLTAMGIELKKPGQPVANYVNAVRAGNLLFLAGKGPKDENGEYITGKIPGDLSMEEGYEAARMAGIELLSVLSAELGDLNKVERIVDVLGMVNSKPEFENHSSVINGCSDLMVAVFGDRGRHARASVGMASLPMNIACEIKMVVQVRD